MIYNGDGTSPTDFQALASLIKSHGLTYQAVTSAELNSMSLAKLTSFGTYVWPGGDSNVMDASLTAGTKKLVRQAVTESGVGFAGFCAGAWIAVGPAPGSANAGWGFSILTGSYLKEYAPGGQYPVAAIVPVTLASGGTRDLVWWGGPYLPTIAGGVVGKYPDGTAAIVQSRAGAGYVAITGLHPEAPQDWRTAQNLVDRDGLDLDIAWNIIQAARTRAPMPAF